MAIPERAQDKKRTDDLGKRLGVLLVGRSVARVLRADDTELAIEFTDGTRLFVRNGETLDISVT